MTLQSEDTGEIVKVIVRSCEECEECEVEIMHDDGLYRASPGWRAHRWPDGAGAGAGVGAEAASGCASGST